MGLFGFNKKENNIDSLIAEQGKANQMEFDKLNDNLGKLDNVFNSSELSELDAMLKGSQEDKDTSPFDFDEAVREYQESGILPGDDESEKNGVRR